MSNVTLNHVDQDLIEFEITQHGSNYSEVMLRHELLDGTKSYHFAVTSLSVNMQHAPIHPITKDETLFTIKRRVNGIDVGAWDYFYTFVGEAPDDDIALGAVVANAVPLAQGFHVPEGVDDNATARAVLQFVAERLGINANQTSLQLVTAIRHSELLTQDVHVCKISPSRPQYSAAEFVIEIQQGLSQFSQQICRDGISRHRHNLGAAFESPAILNLNADNFIEWLSIDTNCDSALIFKPGSRVMQNATLYFFNYFYLEFTPYGAALLGIPLKDLQRRNDNKYILAATNNSFTTPWFQNNQIQAPGNTESIHFASTHPVYSTADQRIKISVGSHLPTLANTTVVNQVQSNDKDIVSAYFQNDVVSEVTYDSGAFNKRLISRVYSGQCNMIKRYDSHHQWNRLMNSYRLRYFRFYVYITYREYQQSTDSFTVVKRELKFDDNEYWNMTVRFVSDV